MLLDRYTKDVYFLERELEPDSRSFILCKVKRFGTMLGRPAELDDLTADKINRFILARLGQVKSETVRGERSVLRGLWSHAFDRGDLVDPPQRIRPVAKIIPEPDGWDHHELRRWLTQAKKLRGTFRHVRDVTRADYWTAVGMACYSLGLRLGDLRRLDARTIKGPGTYQIRQNKSKKTVELHLERDVWAAIKRIRSITRPLIFGSVLSRRSFFEGLAKICKAAGLTGRTKMFRRSAGSYYEKANPGQGHRLLGNGRDVFERHYLVKRIIRRTGRSSPRLRVAS